MFESRYAHGTTGSDVSHHVSHPRAEDADFTRTAAALVAANDARRPLVRRLLKRKVRSLPTQRRESARA